jgi:uncharacterized membrane protein
MSTAAAATNRGPLIAAGFLLGAGLVGFLDGIALHQVLQVHNLLSGRHPPTTLVNVEINMFWDGLFHALCWALTALGLALLWRAGARRDVPWSGRTLLGAILLGGGVFNLVEGVIDHHVLKIHNVVQRLGVSAWDYAFLAAGGVGLALVGAALIRAGRHDAAARGERGG